MFLRMSTQWVYGGMGTRVGLHYPSLDFLFKIHQVKDRKSVLEDIQEIERGVLEATYRQQAKADKTHGT